MKGIKYLTLLLIALCVGGCSDKEEPAVVPSMADITLLLPLAGVGDNGYSDEAYSGVLQTAMSNGLEVSVIRPKTLAQAKKAIQEWNEEGASRRRLLILSDNEYSGLVKEEYAEGDRKSILLFENSGYHLPEEIATIEISRYGAAYLAGVMAQGSREVEIIAGNSADSSVKDAIAGFEAGYSIYNKDGKIRTSFLADDYTGWTKQDEAYGLACGFDDQFVVPLARGANNGIYKFSREMPLARMLIAGMDVDCSLFSKRVPFSLVINIRKAVGELIQDWASGTDIGGHHSFGLSDGGAEIFFSDYFYTVNDIWEQYYIDPAYWKNIYNATLNEAIEAERNYEANPH